MDDDEFTRDELLVLIEACERCDCSHDCYCDRNLEWAKAKLADLDRKAMN